MSEIKNFTMNVDGKEITLTDKSHAGIFRNFFGTFLNLDLQKTMETIELVNIRTSTEELFVAKNGSKKKNIPASDKLFIYTHLTPAAMQKAYDKFLAGWHGTFVANAPVVADDTSAEPETNDDLTPEDFFQTPPADVETDPVMIAKNAISMEDYGVDFCDLLPSQKGKVTKTYNKSLEPVEAEEQDSLDL
jgi:hypothetical protein